MIQFPKKKNESVFEQMNVIFSTAFLHMRKIGKSISKSFNNWKFPKLQWSVSGSKNRQKVVVGLVVSAMLITLVSVALFSHQPTPTAQAAWYNTGGVYWNYRKQITFTADAAKIPSAQANYPALINLASDAGLAAGARDDGYDILFTTSDETTKLSHEIEKFDGTTGELIAWVKVPALTTSTVIYMYYGNSGAANQQNVADVWSNGYVGVYHLPDPTNPISSTGLNNGTNSGTTLGVGKIGGDADFNGTSANISAGTDASLNLTGAWTYSTWIKRNYSANRFDVLFSKWTNKTTARQIYIYYQAQGGTANKIQVDIPWIKAVLTGNTAVTDSNWRFVTVAKTAGNIYTIYMNGVPDGSVTDATAQESAVAAPTYLGYESYDSYYLKGSLDEAKISSTARSADWIATEYANQNSPSTFYQLGGEATGDIVAPTNPTTIDGYSTSGKTTTLTTGNFYNYQTPYFEWPAAEALGGAHDTGNTFVSGVAGYYSYFGTSCGAGGANPASTRGVLSDTGGGIHYSATTNVSVPDLTTNSGTYCLRMKTVDNAGNVSATTEQFIYKYDIANPNPPLFIAANPAGYSSVNSFDFTWPAASDTGGSDIVGYEYMRGGTSGDDWSATQVGTSKTGIVSYQSGENIFLVRSKDNAGNYSATVQTTYYYSNDIPVKSTALEPTPALADANNFSFDWTAPVHSRPIVNYGYSINAYPTAGNLTWTGSSATTLAADHFATLQGENTLYLVAKDDTGAYGLAAANVASTVFVCNTVAPPIPTTVSVVDSSVRAISRYMLTLQWVAGVGQDPATFSHYSIERSTNNVNFAEIATSTSTAYIDASSLSNITTYYYRILAVDNAGSASAPSTVVSKMPTGKFETPPQIVSNPVVSARSTTATVSWVVDRASTASVRFGKSLGDLSQNQISTSTETSHSVEISGLTPGIGYFYQVQSLDDFRDYSAESAYSPTFQFTTLTLPSIANVSVSNITLSSADVSWETSTASSTKVYYGLNIGYGEVKPELDESMTTRHNISLTNLTHTSKYHFKIQGADIEGNILSSDDYVFSTLSMPEISQIEYQPDFSGPAPTVTISWITNVPTSSSVEYSPKDASDNLMFEESQSALVTNHKVTLSNLKDGTDYKFQVKGTDQFGNTVASDIQLLRTGEDSRPPKISNIIVESSNIGSGRERAQIAVSWETDEDSTGQIEYGPGLTSSAVIKKVGSDQGLTKKHLIIVSDLDSSTPYHLKVISKDLAGNTATSENAATTTGSVQRTAFSMIIYTLNSIFGWLGKIFN